MEKLDQEIIVLKDAVAKDKVENESSSLVAPYPYSVIRAPFKGSFMSIPFVGWMTPLLFLGAKRPLENEDLTDLPRGLKANAIASYMVRINWLGDETTNISLNSPARHFSRY